MKKVKRERWVASDGTEFALREDCARHEKFSELVSIVVEAFPSSSPSAAGVLRALLDSPRVRVTVFPPGMPNAQR